MIGCRGDTEREDAKVYYNRGIAWDKKGEHDKAIEDYTEAIRINPKDADTYINRGVAWGEKGELDKAIEDFTEAIRIDPQHAYAYYNRSYAFETKGEKDGSSKVSVGDIEC